MNFLVGSLPLLAEYLFLLLNIGNRPSSPKEGSTSMKASSDYTP